MGELIKSYLESKNEKIFKLLSMGEAGRKRQKELFSIERYVKEFEEVYSILEVSQD